MVGHAGRAEVHGGLVLHVGYLSQPKTGEMAVENFNFWIWIDLTVGADITLLGLASRWCSTVGLGSVGLGTLQQLSWDMVTVILAHTGQASTGTGWSPVVVRGTGSSLVSIHSNLDTQS